MTEHRIIRFVGRDKLGRANSGALLGNPADIVERYYNAGWQSLVLSREQHGGTVEVGKIEPAFRPSERTWNAWDDTANDGNGAEVVGPARTAGVR